MVDGDGVDGLRISDLARRTGVPVATIKFYLRERVLQRGAMSSATQATYGDVHERRLRLVRDLTEVTGLRLARVAELVRALEVDDRAGAQRSLALEVRPIEDPGLETARAETDRFVDTDLGWHVDRASSARAQLARALSILRRVDLAAGAEAFRPHARAADWLSSEEIREPPWSPEDEVVVAIAFDAASAALRRMAWEHRTSASRSAVRSG